MDYLFLILPFILFLVTSFLLNRKKAKDNKLYLYLVSTLEAIISYLFVAAFFLQGFFPRFLYLSISILGLMFLTLIFFYLNREGEDQWDTQIETIKNNILIFFKSLLPFYFLMIIFRFAHPILQISLSLIITIAMHILAVVLRQLWKEPVKVFFRNLSLSSPVKSLWLWITILFVIISNILFELPTQTIKSAFNLNDRVSYWSFDGLPTDIQNNYQSNKIGQWKIEDDLSGAIVDYYETSTHLFIITDKDDIRVIDKSSNEITLSTSLYKQNTYSEDIRMYNYGYYDRFVDYDNQLLCFTSKGVYQITETETTQISTLSIYQARYYFENDTLKMIEHRDATTYHVWEYNSDAFNDVGYIDLNLVDYTKLVVISNTLFTSNNNNYCLFENQTICFQTLFPYKLKYDTEEQVMYVLSGTRFQKITADGTEKTLTISTPHEGDAIVYNNQLLLTGEQVFKVIDEDFEFTSIFHHVDRQAFFRDFKYSNSWPKFKIIDDQIEYIQIDKNQNQTYISIHHLSEINIGLTLPFYTHYGILTIFPILIGCIFELTDNRKHISYYGYYEHIEANKKAE